MNDPQWELDPERPGFERIVVDGFVRRRPVPEDRWVEYLVRNGRLARCAPYGVVAWIDGLPVTQDELNRLFAHEIA